MKIKEVNRTSNIAWSPAAQFPVYLAAGTAAQQLDATFSTTAALEIFDVNFSELGSDMCVKGSIVSEHRFHKVVWGCGAKKNDKANGILVGGADCGNILMYDPAKLLVGKEALICQKNNHSGPVNALDFNKFQDFLFASASCESEIFIWDLNDLSSPITLVTKSLPPEHITSVAWNFKVQSILASMFPTQCVIWDLRRSAPVIVLQDSSSRMSRKIVAWHPEVATQLCIASDHDHNPYIQLWDLRYATTPVRNLEKHQRGVLSVSWCLQDPDLLLSCSKDNHILCWNTSSAVEGGEVICELPTYDHWCFDVAWCPRNPAVLASCSYDGHVCVYSLMSKEKQNHCSSEVAESYPGLHSTISQSQISAPNLQNNFFLKKPPKWLRREIGASFSFGGKLISFSSQAFGHPNKVVGIYQIVTESFILKKVLDFEENLHNGNAVAICHSKANSSVPVAEKLRWSFLEATFAASPRKQMLSLLGYDHQDSETVISELAKQLEAKVDVAGEKLKHSLQSIPSGTEATSYDDMMDLIKDEGESADALKRALLTGNIELAVEVCIMNNRWADAVVLAQAGGYELLQKTQKRYFKTGLTNSTKLIAAVVTSDWSSVIEKLNTNSWKEGLAVILTYAKPEEFSHLCDILGNKLEKEKDLMENAYLCYICSGNLERYAQLWSETHDLNDPMCLWNVVESLMVLRQAVKHLSGSAPAEGGMVSAVMTEFANLLASQGHLSSALTYLGDSQEMSIAVVRDRIHQCLGLQTPYFPFQQVDIPKDPSAVVQGLADKSVLSGVAKELFPREAQVFSSSNPPAQGFIPNTFQPAMSTSASLAQLNGNLQYQMAPLPEQHVSPPPLLPASTMPLSSQVGANSLQPPPHTFSLASQVTTSLPQPLGSTPNIYGGKPAESSGRTIFQRYPKYLPDPSVYSSSNTFASHPQKYYPSQSYAAAHPEMNSQQNMQQQPSTYYSTEQSMVPPSSLNCSMPSYEPHAYTQSQVLAPASGIQPSSYSTVTCGWNDPPLVTNPASVGVQLYQPQLAITTPLPNAPGSEIGQPTSSYSENYYQPYATPITEVPASHEKANLPESPEMEKEKPPIPAEYEVLKKTLDQLVQRCLDEATSPLHRKKLEDASKKLEILYDQMRSNKICPMVVQGLHRIVQALSEGDYVTANFFEKMIVNTVSFSEIGYMPGIKSLIQIAPNLGVFLNQVQ